MTLDEQYARLKEKHRAATAVLKAIADLDKPDAAEVLADVGRGFGLSVTVAETEAK